MEIEFHRLEDSKHEIKMPLRSKNVTQRIICSFKTERLGIVQVVGINKANEDENSENIDIRLSTTSHEPDFNVLAESEQAYVKKYMTAVLLLTFYPHELVN